MFASMKKNIVICYFLILQNSVIYGKLSLGMWMLGFYYLFYLFQGKITNKLKRLFGRKLCRF